MPPKNKLGELVPWRTLNDVYKQNKNPKHIGWGIIETIWSDLKNNIIAMEVETKLSQRDPNHKWPKRLGLGSVP